MLLIRIAVRQWCGSCRTAQQQRYDNPGPLFHVREGRRQQVGVVLGVRAGRQE